MILDQYFEAVAMVYSDQRLGLIPNLLGPYPCHP